LLPPKEQRNVFHMGFFIGCASSGCHVLPFDDIEAQVLKAVGNIFHQCVLWNVVDYCLDRLFRIWEMVK
jgi:hypothetical protein